MIVFLVIYFFTCLLGALLFLADYRPFISLFEHFSGTHVPSLNSTQGMVVLMLLCAAPVYLWLGFALALRIPAGALRVPALQARRRSAQLDTPSWLPIAVFGVCGAVALASVGRAGAFSELSSWFSYGRFISARESVFSHLHFFEFVNIYMFLPFAAAWVLLTQRRGGFRWLVVRWLPLMFTEFIDLLLFQKKTAIISLLVVGFAWFFFQRRAGIRSRRLARGAWGTVAVGLTIFFATVVVPVYTETSQGGGTLPALAAYSVLSPLTRTSAPVLYYPIVYPRQHPFYGLDLGQDELGFPSAFPNDNQVVWNAQNPHGPSGTSAAPFQFSLYSGTGLFGALVETLLIGGLMGLVWRLATSEALPAVWGSLLASSECIFGVYLAIDSWRNDTTVSYGALWSLFFLAVTASTTYIVNGQARRLAPAGRWWRALPARLQIPRAAVRRNVAWTWEAARPWRSTVAYGLLWAPIAALWALRSPFQFSESGRAVTLEQVLLARSHGFGPLVAMIGAHAFRPAPLGDDPGGYLFTPWLMGLFDIRSVGTALDGAFAASVAVVVGAYPYFIRRLTGSRIATAFSPLLALAALSFLAPNDFYWVPACTVLLCVPWLLVLARRGTLPLGPMLTMAGLAGLTSTFRSNTGLGIAIALGALIVTSKVAWRRRAFSIAGVAACYLLLSTGVLFLAYSARADRMRGYPVNTHGQYSVTNWSEGAGHPFWHTAYLGLGVVPNPYGIRFLDSVAAAYVKKVDPKAAYLSARYEAILRNRVIFIAEHDPGLVIDAFATKGGIEIANALNEFPILLILVPLALLAGVARGRRLKCTAVLAPVAGIAVLPVLAAVPNANYEVPWLAFWATIVVLTGSAAIAWIVRWVVAEMAGAPAASPLARRAEVLRARTQLGLDVCRRALSVVTRPAERVARYIRRWALSVVSVMQDLRLVMGPLLGLMRRQVRSRAALLVLATLAGGVVAMHYLNTIRVASSSVTPPASSVTPSALPASTRLPRSMMTTKVIGLPVGWSYGDRGVKLRPSAGETGVHTTATLDGYQLMSPTRVLRPGRYVATVLGRVVRGGLDLGVLDASSDRWITTMPFAPTAKQVIMPMGFSVVRTTRVELILSNYSLRRLSSSWYLTRVGLYRGSVAGLAARQPPKARVRKVRAPTKQGFLTSPSG
jgi:hypothetical protein